MLKRRGSNFLCEAGSRMLLITDELPPSLESVQKGPYFDELAQSVGPKEIGGIVFRHLVADWKLQPNLETARIANRLAADSSLIMERPNGINEYTAGVLEYKDRFEEAGITHVPGDEIRLSDVHIIAREG